MVHDDVLHREMVVLIARLERVRRDSAWLAFALQRALNYATNDTTKGRTGPEGLPSLEGSPFDASSRESSD